MLNIEKTNIITNNIVDWRWWLGVKPKKFHSLPARRMGISAIIPAHNEEASIAETIKSLLRQSYPLDRIIVVCDNCSDHTFECASAFKFLYGNVLVVRTVGNKDKKAGAQIEGLKHVQSELVVTIDADTILDPRCIEEMITYFSDEKTGVVSAFIIPQKTNTWVSLAKLGQYMYSFTLEKGAQQNAGAILIASGCCSIYRTEEVRRLNAFDPRTMGEDLDAAWRMKEAGWDIHFAEKAICYPIEPSDFRTYVAQTDRWYAGYFQNIKIRKFRLLGIGWRMSILAYAYILLNITAPFSLVFVMFMSVVYPGNYWWLVYPFMGVQLAIMYLYALPRAYKYGLFWKTVVGVFIAFLLSFIDKLLYLRRLCKEWIFDDSLDKWNKGH